LHGAHSSLFDNRVFQGIRQYRTGGGGDFRHGPATGMAPPKPAAACPEPQRVYNHGKGACGWRGPITNRNRKLPVLADLLPRALPGDGAWR
jgi:hypothetical protein